ncbi:MAG: double-strand break repair protein AddB [Pseudomonadota bacterium]
MIFPPNDSPRVFALPPGTDFIRAFVKGLDNRLNHLPPEASARLTIWVNSRRAERSLHAELASGRARILPRIRVLADLPTDPVLAPELVPPLPKLRRKLDLARLVTRLVAAEPGLASKSAAFDLADSLSELAEDMAGQGVAAEALRKLDPGDHAAHWQRSLRFLNLIGEVTDGLGEEDGQGRLRTAARILAMKWSQAAPQDPIIVAGSTGSRGGTRAFMRLIAQQPQGALVLPGYDPHLSPGIWRDLAAEDEPHAEHPQAAFARLSRDVGFEPADLPAWHTTYPPAPERNALVSLALRPAPVTSQWRSEGPRLRPRLASACADLTWVEAPDPRSEARAIAFALREAAEDRKRAALITPERTLARRVAAELDRWRLIPDDSAGRPLALTPPGILLRLTAELIGVPIGSEAFLALIKHPLVNSAPGMRRRHMDLVSRLEMDCLRGGPPQISWATFRAWAENLHVAAADELDAPAWVRWLEQTLAPLRAADPKHLEGQIETHRAAAEALAAGPDAVDAGALWQKASGQACRALFEELEREAPGFGPVDAADYRALLLSQLRGRDVPEEAVVTNAQIAIWGTLEARVQSADLIILGALNEGVWPAQPSADPWLNRGMRRELRLPLPERQIGLAAHDFQQAMAAPKIIVTRATRDAEAPTVASRWLLRLENLLSGLGEEGKSALCSAKSRGKDLLTLAAHLDLPEASVPSARRPSPRPPIAARPEALSVTQLETLVRNPYEIYAKKILRLEKLLPPGPPPDAMARGSAIHTALQQFVSCREEHLGEDGRDALLSCIDAVLRNEAPWPATREIWRARLARAAMWFVETERERRQFATPRAFEIRGKRRLGGTPLPFTVTAKADRIDVTADGGCAIYDYKSGSVPSVKEIAAFHLQLPLEGAIAASGGFEGIGKVPPRRLQLIGLGAQKIAHVPEAGDDVARVWTRLAELISAYQSPTTGYTARLRPQRLTYESDYDHLSRRGEWSDGDDPESAL